MKLYQYPLSPNCQKVVAVAYEVGVPLTSVPVAVFQGEARSAELLAKNPNGRVPILEDEEEKLVLWESNAMLGYVAAKADRADLAPTTPRDRADVDRWLAWSNAHFAPAVRKVAFERVVKKLAGLGAPDEAAIAAGTEDFRVVASVIDRCLDGKDYLCGGLTVADFSIITYAAVCENVGLDVAPYRSFRRWVGRMLARDSVQRTLRASREAS